MERTHLAERERDEALIERKRTEGARGRAGEVARKSFRGGRVQIRRATPLPHRIASVLPRRSIR